MSRVLYISDRERTFSSKSSVPFFFCVLLLNWKKYGNTRWRHGKKMKANGPITSTYLLPKITSYIHVVSKIVNEELQWIDLRKLFPDFCNLQSLLPVVLKLFNFTCSKHPECVVLLIRFKVYKASSHKCLSLFGQLLCTGIKQLYKSLVITSFAYFLSNCITLSINKKRF